jgi:hypothetical protein
MSTGRSQQASCHLTGFFSENLSVTVSSDLRMATGDLLLREGLCLRLSKGRRYVCLKDAEEEMEVGMTGR